MRLPPPLSSGARVALVAPSGPLRSRAELDAATAQAHALGWEPVVGEHALSKNGYLAGTDEQRLHDLNAALADRSVDGIWCLRGGYGAMRLLDGVDVDAMRNRPRALIGYSDITALHAAFGAGADVVTFHGLIEQRDPCGVAMGATVLRGGRAEGRLVGGNLALLAALCGTRFAPDYTNAILILEDVGEQTYRIDRMLRQLALSGALSCLAGIVYGRFTDGTDPADESSCELSDVLREAADLAGVPAISNAPIGHIDDQWTLPIGARAELDADQCRLTVALR
jgi:muramoyltetrapeptide carboxypeptidase